MRRVNRRVRLGGERRRSSLRRSGWGGRGAGDGSGWPATSIGAGTGAGRASFGSQQPAKRTVPVDPVNERPGRGGEQLLHQVKVAHQDL